MTGPQGMGPLQPLAEVYPGLWAWYDAQDSASLVLSGAAVAQWKDKSGHARHIGQLTAGEQPQKTGSINSFDCVTFDGGDRLRGACSSPNLKSMYAVIVVDSNPNDRQSIVEFDLTAGTGARQWWHLSKSFSGFPDRMMAGWVTPLSASVNSTQPWRYRNAEPLLLGWSGDDVTNAMAVRQWEQEQITTSISAKMANPTAFDVGNAASANTGFYGRIGELMIFDVVHTLAERTFWINALGTKWGIVPASSISDNCNRANVGPPPGGIFCEESVCTILSNQLKSPAAGGTDTHSISWRPLDSINMYAQADLTHIDGNFVSVRRRNQDSTGGSDIHGYYGRYYTSTGEWEIYRYSSTGGFNKLVGVAAPAPTLPYTCRLQAIGNGSTVYLSLYELVGGVPALKAAYADTNAERHIDERLHFGWRSLSNSISDNWTSASVSLVGWPSNPSVTINKAVGQADPVSAGGAAVFFDVVFDEFVTGFTAADVDLSSSTVSGTLVASITTSNGKEFTIQVGGITGSGNVIATIPSAVCTSVVTGTSNNASTSTDNSIAYTYVAFNPVTAFAWKHLYYVDGAAFQALGLANGASMAAVNWPDEIATNAAPLTAGTGTYRTSVTELNGHRGVQLVANTAGKRHTAVVAAGAQQALPFTIIGIFAFASGGVNGYVFDGANEGSSGNRVLVRVGSGPIWNLFMGTSINGTAITITTQAIRVKAISGVDVLTANGVTAVNADAGGATWQGLSMSEGGVVMGGANPGWYAMYGVYPGDITADANWANFQAWVLTTYGVSIS